MSHIENQYHIDLNNTGFIQAIATHNQHVSITKIVDESGAPLLVPAPKCFRELPEMLEAMKSRGIRNICITFESDYSKALIGILPRVNVSAAPIEVPPTYQKQASFITQISKHFEQPAPRTFSRPPSDLVSESVEICKATVYKILASHLKDRNLVIMSMLNIGYEHALDFPELEHIIFECGSMFAAVGYGRQGGFSILDKMSLDMNRGFITHNMDFDSRDPNQIFAIALQPFFVSWKAKNYTGKLIPDTISVTFADRAEPITSREPFALFKPNNEQKTTARDDQGCSCAIA